GPQALDAVLVQLPSAEVALPQAPPDTVGEAWGQIEEAFVPLEGALMDQADRPSEEPAWVKRKVELAWRLTDATAWMLLRLLELDASPLDSLRAEAEAQPAS